MGLVDVLRYLLSHSLAGNDATIEAIRSYFVENESVSSIARRLGRSKDWVKGKITRITERMPFLRARIAVMMALSAIEKLGIEPIYVCGENTCICRICGHHVENSDTVKTLHIRSRHRDLLDELVEQALRGFAADGGGSVEARHEEGTR